MIEFKNVSKRFGPKVVLDDLSLSIESGEIFFIIGKSGTGKSVFLKHIVGLLVADSGQVIVDGQSVGELRERDLFYIRKKCGLVFQQPALLDSLTVYENVAFGIRAHQLAENESQIREQVLEKLKLVNLDDSILQQYPPETSFAVQKRVSIARTLAIQPAHLLFDEPTTAQDPVATSAINALISKVSKTLGVTSIVVSHDMHCALEIADRIVLLNEGKIEDMGTASELLASSKQLTKDFLIEAKEHSFA